MKNHSEEKSSRNIHQDDKSVFKELRNSSGNKRQTSTLSCKVIYYSVYCSINSALDRLKGCFWLWLYFTEAKLN